MNGASVPAVCLHGRYTNNPTFSFTHYEIYCTFLGKTFANQSFSDNDYHCFTNLTNSNVEVNCSYAHMNAGMEVTAPIILNVSFSPSMPYLQGKSPGTYQVSRWLGGSADFAAAVNKTTTPCLSSLLPTDYSP